MITDYFKYQEEYQKKYGERTVVLYQNGTFYEIFCYSPESDETGEPPAWPTEKIGHASYISTLLPYKFTRRNNNKPYSFKNPGMIGFPMIAFETHKDKILSREFTIVLVEQERDGPNAPRRVTRVLSPATEINDLSPIPVTNQIVSVYIEVQKEEPKYEDYLITVGISTIDVTTGNNIVSEIYSKTKDQVYAIQELYRFLYSIKPRELIININRIGKNIAQKYKEYIINTLELDIYPIYTVIVNEIDKEYLEINYHQQFLTKIFHSKQDKTTYKGGIQMCIVKQEEIVINQDTALIIEDLGLERLYYGTISYILLLQYCYEHDERLLEKIKKPDTQWLDHEKHLIIADNALKQLDIISPTNTKGITSLFSVVNNTSTALGQRYLRTMLCNPITDKKELNNLYDMTQELINNQGLFKTIETHLKSIPDLERYQRKVQLKLINPNEFSKLFRAYIEIVNLYTTILTDGKKIKSLLFSQVNEFNECLTTVLSKYNLDNLGTARVEKDRIVSEKEIFYVGRDMEADKFYTKVKEYNDKINAIVTHLNSHLNGTRGKLLEYTFTDKNGALGFITTAHKGKVLSKSTIDTELCGNIQLVTVNKDVLVTSDVIGSLCQSYNKIKDEYEQYMYRCYTSTITKVSQYTFFTDINIFISKLDYIKSNAKSAINNKYLRPIISDVNSDVSFMDIKDLRHPVAEKLIDGKYITNDISLGSKPYGMLLYGANAIGKSTLTKALGLNIIMAQAGMFTACQMTYQPYTKIITRLSGDDNLIKGQSSYIVEMSELRTILRNADSKTLVLGDELCRGTETQSGSAIAIQSIIELNQRKTSYIFSTHMHHLATDPDILSIPTNELRICHLRIKYDETSKTLIFDRKLQDGSGESIYGLEVAMSLSFDHAFIKGAADIRKRMIGQGDKILSTRTSKYNRKVYVDSCVICGHKPYLTKGIMVNNINNINNNNKNLNSHHIEEQEKADDKGYIDYYHKDKPDNIMILCETCHTTLHQNGLKVITKQTPNGKVINIPL